MTGSASTAVGSGMNVSALLVIGSILWFGALPLRGLRELLDELATEVSEGLVVWPLKCAPPEAFLQSCAVGVNPERDILILDAGSNVGLRNSGDAPVSDLFPQVVKHIIDPLLDFNLESCQLRSHVAERDAERSAAND